MEAALSVLAKAENARDLPLLMAANEASPLGVAKGKAGLDAFRKAKGAHAWIAGSATTIHVGLAEFGFRKAGLAPLTGFIFKFGPRGRARRQRGDRGKPDRLQARRRRRGAKLFRAARGGDTAQRAVRTQAGIARIVASSDRRRIASQRVKPLGRHDELRAEFPNLRASLVEAKRVSKRPFSQHDTFCQRTVTDSPYSVRAKTKFGEFMECPLA